MNATRQEQSDIFNIL